MEPELKEAVKVLSVFSVVTTLAIHALIFGMGYYPWLYRHVQEWFGN